MSTYLDLPSRPFHCMRRANFIGVSIHFDNIVNVEVTENVNADMFVLQRSLRQFLKRYRFELVMFRHIISLLYEIRCTITEKDAHIHFNVSLQSGAMMEDYNLSFSGTIIDHPDF